MNLRSEIEQLTPSLRRLAHALVAGGENSLPDAGDDLVHETLLRALRFDTPANNIATRHWLYAILVGINRQRERIAQNAEAGQRNATQSLQQRRNMRFPRSLRPDYVPAPGNHESHPFKAAARSNDAGLFHALALEEREALMLVVLEGLSYGVAAAILGLPRPTLIARIARARASLAAQMKQSLHRGSPDSRTHLRLVR